MASTRKPIESYAFMITKKFPKHKSFEILRQPEGDFVSAFIRTLSHIFKGD